MGPDLAAARREVFHGSPVVAAARLESLADAAGSPVDAAAAGWLHGVALGATGRYAAALTTLHPLLTAAQAARPGDPRRPYGALAAATAASVHRQLADHASGQQLDTLGLAVADGDPWATFDCRLGLAADAVGLKDAAAAGSALARADSLVEPGPTWWRARVRLAWVRAELALLRGAAGEAVRAGADAVDAARDAGAPRHFAKGLLFLGVAQAAAGPAYDGRAAEAVATLTRAAGVAARLGARPLVWPARLVLARLLAGTDPAAAEHSRRLARETVAAVAADSPAELAARWLAGPELAELLAADRPG